MLLSEHNVLLLGAYSFSTYSNPGSTHPSCLIAIPCIPCRPELRRPGDSHKTQAVVQEYVALEEPAQNRFIGST